MQLFVLLLEVFPVRSKHPRSSLVQDMLPVFLQAHPEGPKSTPNDLTVKFSLKSKSQDHLNEFLTTEQGLADLLVFA